MTAGHLPAPPPCHGRVADGKGSRRPSKADQKKALERSLEQSKSTIVFELTSHPLRQPVNPRFYPYYLRVLNGDMAAILDYCDREWPVDSYYELIGRLVTLQSDGAVKQIVAEIARRGNPFYPNEEDAYEHWYNTLKRDCKRARAFIRHKYRADASVKREQLWNPYVNQCCISRRDRKGAARSEEIRKLKEWAETGDSHRREPPSLNDMVDRFSINRLVPKQIFFELAESYRISWDRAGQDKRCRNRRFRWTPSFIARKHACEMVGISPSTVSHKNRRK